MLTKLVIISQYIHMLNHFVVYLKLIECFMSKKKKKRILLPTQGTWVQTLVQEDSIC